jgi:hypothetical protein
MAPRSHHGGIGKANATAEYSALLMNVTQGKCYTPKEYGAILRELGFQTQPYQDTIGDRGFFTAVKR